MITTLGIKCSFAAKGCGSLNNTLTVDTVTKHEKECGHGPAQCAHEGCPNTKQGSLKLMEVASHKVQCEWRLVDCPNNCGVGRMLAKDVQQHNDPITGCTHKVMLCSTGCGQHVKRRDMQQHQHSECSKTLIGCCVEECEFRAERGAHNVWDNHNQTNATAHLSLTMKAIKQLSNTVSAQQGTIQRIETTYQQQIKQLETTRTQQTQTNERKIIQLSNTVTQLVAARDEQSDINSHQQYEIIQLSSTVSAQQQVICSLQSQVLSTRPQATYTSQLTNDALRLSDSSPSVDWVVTRITSRWNTGFRENSDELTFHHIPNASLRYSFKILVDVNHEKQCQGHVGVYFVPVRGPNHTSLQWPISNHIKLEVLNVKGGQNKSNVSTSANTKEFFAKHSPPADNNTEGRGWDTFLTQAEVDSGDFVVNDAMVVRCTLLEVTFA